jgi:aminopeptidase N
MRRMKNRHLTFLCIFFLFSACSSGPSPDSDGATRSDAPGLSREHAAYRTGVVSGVTYDLSFALDADRAEYSGTAVVEFDLKTWRAPLTLDFAGGTVTGMTVNGTPQAVNKDSYNGKFISFPTGTLLAGHNRVEIAFTHPYSATSSGLYRFKDPEDGRVYLYTDLEPYFANQVYPCFDQPDLKAKFTLQVDAPESWTVISAMRGEKSAPSGEARKRWKFPQSPLMATYVFAMHAGEYRVWQSGAENIPLRLFARQSLASHVDVEEWFDLTRRGFKFYQDYFATPYPFQKYDQILVPDFNWGGMENVGAVTFNERRYVFRGKPTLTERERRASTILHEMAHMWFGDLVTMKWWDDLWLNESFATYAATVALTEATEYAGAWETFFTRAKAGAYYEDGLKTTHPIAFRVPDTEQTAANFDGITYGKGASTLKQLVYVISRDKFRAGLKDYFDGHAFANATLSDFFAAMTEASGKDLGPWAKDWIETSGFDAVRAEWTCDGDKISSFKLVPEGPSGSPARSHRGEVALYGAGVGGVPVEGARVPVSYGPGEAFVPELSGKACPVFAYPNAGDEDYVKVVMNAKTAATLKSSLARIEPPLTRIMLWRSLWDGVLDGNVAWTDYADTVFSQLPGEPDFRIVQAVANTIAAEKPYFPTLNRFVALGDKDSAGLRAAYREKLEHSTWERFQKASGSDETYLWFDTFVRVSDTGYARDALRAVLNGEALPSGFSLDQDRRWNVVAKLGEMGVPEAAELIAREAKADKSNAGKAMALTARAALPVEADKAAWLEKIADPSAKVSSADFKSVMAGLFPLTQAGQRLAAADRTYAVLEKIAPEREALFLESYVQLLTPTACLKESEEKLKNFIKAHPDLPPIALKNLRNAEEEEARCLLIQDKASRAVAGVP